MHAVSEGRRLPNQVYLEVKYESLLTDPDAAWGRIAAFIDIEKGGSAGEWLRRQARRDNFGKWRTELSKGELCALEPHIRPKLEFLGYAWTD